MDRIINLSFLSRVGLCMVISLILNAIIGQYLKSSLSKGNFMITVDAIYGADATMELLYDTGKDFSQKQRVPRPWKKGQRRLEFPFELKKGEQLRYLRLDFGTDTDLKKVEINSITLASEGKVLFQLKKEEISQKIGLLTGISEVDAATAKFILDPDIKPFDPYIVFNAVNELIFPKWQRTMALVLPWLVLFFLPLLKWLNSLRKNGDYVLIGMSLFCAAIPLKIAWVTFTTLILTAYALFNCYKTKTIDFNPIYGALLVFFLVPLLFLGNGQVSQLSIPFGFVLVVIIGALSDFSDKVGKIKKIYATVFLTVSSITIVSWLLLMLYNGYYYKIDWPGYFMDIKAHAHATIFWLYYPHTTFLSFFIVIGGIFCFDLYEKKEIGRTYGLFYGVLGFCTLLLLGSRFAVLMGISLPVLVRFPVKKLSRWLVPVWAVIASLIVCFIGDIDFRRNQLWRISWAAFKEKPWLGHGTGSSEMILNDLGRVQSAGFDTVLDMNHAHNQLLTYMLENGLLGTLLFLCALLYIVYRFAKQRNKSMLLLCFMVLLLMITESPFRTTTPLYVIGILFSVFASQQKPGACIRSK